MKLDRAREKRKIDGAVKQVFDEMDYVCNVMEWMSELCSVMLMVGKHSGVCSHLYVSYASSTSVDIPL